MVGSAHHCRDRPTRRVTRLFKRTDTICLCIVPRQAPMHTMLVITIVVTNAANNSHFVHDPCLQRQRLTDMCTGNVRSNWLERPTYFSRCVRLRIVCFKMAGPAVQPILDDRRIGHPLTFHFGHRTCLQNQRQGKTTHTRIQKSTSINDFSIVRTGGC